MTDETKESGSVEPTKAVKRPRRAASRPAGPPVVTEAEVAPAAKSKAAAAKSNPKADESVTDAEVKRAAPRKKTRGGLKKAAESAAGAESVSTETEEKSTGKVASGTKSESRKGPKAVPLAAVFQPADQIVKEKPAKAAAKAAAETDSVATEVVEPRNKNNRNRKRGRKSEAVEEVVEAVVESADNADADSAEHDPNESAEARRRRRRRGGRGRNRRDEIADGTDAESAEESENQDPAEGDVDGEGSSTRRRRRRRGASEDADEATSTARGSTRLEAKKQRRRDGRDAGRRRAPILSEAEFLARRENVNRVMALREVDDRVQIAVLEDDILVEHYVNKTSGSSLIGNVYLGRIQNVLPSMEAAFVDIGKGRNAVLYAGEVNWDAAGLEGQAKRIESAFKTGDPVLVQVTKDPIGHKGARLTAQISLPGRFVVYVPDGSMTGISRKLPEKERNRLKSILRSVLPEEAGVIVRTAAEGASEEDLQKDVARLMAQWEVIAEKAKTANAPALLHSEPDLAIRVVRDIFNEDFNELVVSGDGIYETIEQYVSFVAPDLTPRIRKWVDNKDLFTRYRIDEQLAKGLDRKVWLPSGGSLVIDRTEAMTVVDVNTGKFVGEGGNLEQTVTRNNLEAAEEIVRQLRLRDIGGIIVIDFIDMVLESNRDLVLRRLIESLSRDRTKHQVAEVTSLGLVQMTRKRIGQGLLETFSENCECCNGRGVKVSLNVSAAKAVENDPNQVESDSV